VSAEAQEGYRRITSTSISRKHLEFTCRCSCWSRSTSEPIECGCQKYGNTVARQTELTNFRTQIWALDIVFEVLGLSDLNLNPRRAGDCQNDLPARACELLLIPISKTSTTLTHCTRTSPTTTSDTLCSSVTSVSPDHRDQYILTPRVRPSSPSVAPR
jgi:hypothetical protein